MKEGNAAEDSVREKKYSFLFIQAWNSAHSINWFTGINTRFTP